MDFLLFRLYNWLCSWGLIANGELRTTYIGPTKSSIIGLIAASLGISRTENDLLLELSHDIGFSVKIENPGILLTDYHTSQVPSKSNSNKTKRSTRKLELESNELNTILSYRDYRMDSLYTVAVWNKNPDTKFKLEDIKLKLIRPTFQLYLGRKSCPLSLPLTPKLVHSSSLRKAYEEVLFSTDEFIQNLIEKSGQQILWENIENFESGFIPDMKVVLRDSISNREMWQFKNRQVNLSFLNS